MIKIENLSFPYALQDITCTFAQGKLIGIMGANGAGKSTLLKAIAGILTTKCGQIWLNHRKLSDLSPHEKSQQLAYLAQNTQIHWDLSTYDVIALGLLQPHSHNKALQKVRSMAEKFALASLLDKPFKQLSGGEKARVQLARCCIKEAPLLLADEPIAPLDPYYQIDIMQQLKALTPDRTCVIAIHHLSLAYRFCDEVILLGNGKIIASGATQSVLTEDNLATAFGIRAQIDPLRREIFAVEKSANQCAAK
ncbi:ABC transporter ATP-binding protein [Testudinibacter sp. TR-2022]|uniref:ABC transporter ATP-binding protein n=1 Tax=Testudinibacter sp. TR-2022 TaxID=2585029 RepID=UPI00111B179D|nr:ABC transporter ATP-binding protein [Testudinibacter sp. TR-2022]TNH05583.1 ABC transporter ATP-binding protein [Pasteurellaceae bacterium Phil31]TNH08110.1 ABC transporter ATP-binding protein [Testudinibacter sp. TR-2022]TNH09516.1 ABC transporter ATP-binding protein [Testudinibacter sp. TR-2022]TNH15377.1 ABC transporter ATP-binding protein [Testudinibacter sp. TR-2022]TNH17127.1 ABC transporter ATP-binding protein [Testudinibacter sp. TR-2022]